MRVVGEILHSNCKITIFSWNNRYLLKFEQGYLEQTYKIDQYDVADEQDLRKLVDEHFVGRALKVFDEMNESLRTALGSL
jgi:hypothetical protein